METSEKVAKEVSDYYYEHSEVIKATPEEFWPIVSKLETWNRFYPGTVLATYCGQNEDVPKVGATVIEKYIAKSGYAVLYHKVVAVDEGKFIKWEGKVVDAPILVGNVHRKYLKAVRGVFYYTIQPHPDGIKWTRKCCFHTVENNEIGIGVYTGFMEVFFPGLLESLQVYMMLVKEHVESLLDRDR